MENIVQLYWCCSVFLLSMLAVEGFPGGAPSDACSTLSPSSPDHGAEPQTTPPPYQVDLRRLPDADGNYSYLPGTTYIIRLSMITCTIISFLELMIPA